MKPIDFAEIEIGELEARLLELKADNKVLRERLDAVEALTACYRLQRSPTEKLFKRLEKTKQALIEQALKAPE